MQDKIQEIMGLVQLHRDLPDSEWKVKASLEFIRSKLRELVREPLSDEEAWEIALNSDNAMHAIRLAERAHNITNTSGEV